jgi:hypothetical protein
MFSIFSHEGNANQENKQQMLKGHGAKGTLYTVLVGI